MLKKTGIRFLIFLAILISGYYLMYFLLFNIKIQNKPIIKALQNEIVLQKNVYHKVYNEFDFNSKYDIVFLGSSHCYRCLDPKIFEKENLKVYNLGSSSQTPLNSYSILKKIKAHTLSILLEVYPVIGDLTGKESFMSMAASNMDFSLVSDMAFELNDLRCYNILSILPILNNYEKTQSYDSIGFYKGYFETKDSIKTPIKYESYKLSPKNMDVQLNYIKKIVKLCKESNIKLAFVFAPVPSEQKVMNEEYYINGITQICADDRMCFFNYGRLHNLNSKMNFCDDDHLNKSGVELFNKRLISEMKSLSFFK